MEPETDADPVCGVCLESSIDSIDLESLYDVDDVLISVYMESKDCNKLTYMDCFRECTRIGENVSDYVPQCICMRCSLDLKVAYKFVKKAKSAAQFFQKLIESQSKDFESKEYKKISDGIKEFEEISFHSTESKEVTSIDILDQKALTDNEDDYAEDNITNDHINKDISQLVVFQTTSETEQRKGNPSKKNAKSSESADNIEELDVKCKQCEYTDKGFKVLVHEKLNHSNDYLCHVCSKTFRSLGALNAHIKIHKQSNFKSETCEICGKKFSKAYFRQHLEVHKNERKLYKCKHCDKLFFSKSYMDTHMKMHNGETMSCLECGKQFTRGTDLSIHMRFHTREFPYSCEICGKMFVVKSHLQTHMWRHQGLKLKCTDCGKLFISEHALREHSFIHTEMPFPCCYCKKEYPSKYKFTVHLKSAHSICLSEEEIKKIKRPINKKAPTKLILVRDESPNRGKTKE